MTKKAAQIARGRHQGAKNAAIPGFLSWVSSHLPKAAQRRGGLTSKKRRRGIFGLSPSQKAKNAVAGGKAVGMIASSTGQIQKLSLTEISPEKARKIRSMGGKISGKQNHENGIVGKFGWSLHVRWHLNRKRKNPRCSHCKPQ